MDLPGRTIKTGARRTVVDLGPEVGAVVKVFHARGGFRDAARARAEARAAEALAGAGVATPALIGVEEVSGAPALRFRRVDGARSLGDALAEAGGARGRRRAIARAAAELLLGMAGAGATHPDLHPGNVLLDAQDRAWIIDVRGARVGRSQRAWRRSVAALCGAVRERHGRAASLAAARLGRAVPGLDLGRLADEARAARREACARRVRVWTRDSAATRVDPGGVVRVRDGVIAPREGDEVARLALPRAAARGAWATLVRAHLHALPAAVPVALHPDGVEYAAPPGARVAAPPGDDALAALLEDRGLAAAGPALLDGDGRALIGPASDLVAAGAGRAGGRR